MDNSVSNDEVDHTIDTDHPAHPIFGNICLPFLEEKCFSACTCLKLHKLLPKEQVQRNLEVCEFKDVNHAHHNYLFKYDKLFVEYFSVFAKYYGHKKYPECLRRSIESIADKRDTAYFKDILNGLLMCGMQYHTVVALLFLELPATLDQTERFHLLWPILLDTRNKKACEHLKLFETSILEESDGTASQFIDALLDQLNINEFNDLIMFCIKLLKECAITTLHQIDTAAMKQFVDDLYISSKKDAVAITRRMALVGKQLD